MVAYAYDGARSGQFVMCAKGEEDYDKILQHLMENNVQDNVKDSRNRRTLRMLFKELRDDQNDIVMAMLGKSNEIT